jgi:hypothetical protein
MNIRRLFYKLYYYIQSIIVPNFENGFKIYERIIKKNINSQTTWLDIGCGKIMFPYTTIYYNRRRNRVLITLKPG